MSDASPKWNFPEARPIRGFVQRMLHLGARLLPGGAGLRVSLHRARGVKIGQNVWIGLDVIVETNRPWLVEIEDDVRIGVRTTIIAHYEGAQGVKIGKAAYVGPGVLILPNVSIGHGAVVAAGSVVTRNVPPLTMVQGNPAVAVARSEVPMGMLTMKQFARRLKPISAGTKSRTGEES